MQTKLHTYTASGRGATYLPPSGRTTLLSVVLIVVLGLAVYANALDNAFVWDDEVLSIHEP